MREWLRICFQRKVVVRGLKFAIIVGTILIVINQGDVLLNGNITTLSWLKILLTVTVPYFVSTLSSVGAIRESRKRTNRD
ncbi:phosphoenolpyruvate protein kinase [candidate division KSB1 bacterium]|nr:phosphoenolpyruvate protein kinase [candidate division KSB1 bacterium]NIR70273.1 phosphoenolpyruvate protein kinase [candidate division KSB1 bacterium]NIS26543.1 phosphoenolpyruvate protein kinase [candidate division KSB1 bacterium]NIT73306.1 phosphoenolpyruvate protein kinase [candidate division KSB1 bacterium]NIU23929.1 phosphoenolpyruvate protein kinase [candidate division KSB1 bacterium]